MRCGPEADKRRPSRGKENQLLFLRRRSPATGIERPFALGFQTFWPFAPVVSILQGALLAVLAMQSGAALSWLFVHCAPRCRRVNSESAASVPSGSLEYGVTHEMPGVLAARMSAAICGADSPIGEAHPACRFRSCGLRRHRPRNGNTPFTIPHESRADWGRSAATTAVAVPRGVHLSVRLSGLCDDPSFIRTGSASRLRTCRFT
jgi:hypothetical protein